MLTQDPANGAGRDLEAELAELALEAEIAPASVLLGQLADQLPALFADRGSTAARTTGEGRPLLSDQLEVPAEHRFRHDQQRGPRGPWQPARQGGKDETIGLAPADSLHLAFQDSDLVAQHQQLGLISGAAAERARARSMTVRGRREGRRRAWTAADRNRPGRIAAEFGRTLGTPQATRSTAGPSCPRSCSRPVRRRLWSRR